MTGKQHYIEEDLEWLDLGIHCMVLVWETECFLDRHAEFDAWLTEHPDKGLE